MRVVVTGATGNVGASVLEALGREDGVTEIVGIARRLPHPRFEAAFPKVDFVTADVAQSDLEHRLRGADAVVHLAWRLQPSRRPRELDHTNVEGSRRVFEAARRVGVRVLVYASSVGVYSAGPKDHAVDESWPRDGISTSLYSRQKAQTEKLLDDVESQSPDLRVVRFRPGLVFKREAASEIRRLFLGPLVPRWALSERALRVLPKHSDLVFQAVHASDVAEAVRLALLSDVRGPFNLAAEPALTSQTLADALDARPVPVPAAAMHALASITWRLRLQPADPGWMDLLFEVPLMDTGRARRDLGWAPTRTATSALLELLDGMREGAGMATKPLAPAGRSMEEASVHSTGMHATAGHGTHDR